jgi:hypothetical protein
VRAPARKATLTTRSLQVVYMPRSVAMTAASFHDCEFNMHCMLLLQYAIVYCNALPDMLALDH